jgi:NAD(P)-dependent dehydrogenase (short-subunit alcohol dehydrogenase family)
MFEVADNVCVVTGAGGALGGEVAKQLAGEGAKVVVLDKDKEKCEQISSDIIASGGVSFAIACDVLEIEQLEKARIAVSDRFGAPDCLINAAGGNSPSGTTDCEFYSEHAKRSFPDLDVAGLKSTFDLNYFGTVYPTKVFSRDMLERKNGSIINFASVSAINPLTKVVSYSSAKAAVVNFTKWLAVHYSRSGVRVNAIAPGFVMTEQLRFLHVNSDGSYTTRAKQVLAHTPMNRYAETGELCGVIQWLTSPASSYVTGSLITVDGGFSAYTI